jgi:hypothetical protein
MDDYALSPREAEKIEKLIKQREKLDALKSIGKKLSNLFPTSKEVSEFTVGRRLGIYRKINVNNISGKKAWIIISPVPLKTISSIGTEKLGNISFCSEGEYKCQQSVIADNRSMEFKLDNNQIYYSVFFDFDGKWKTPFINRRINAKIYDINLLERHIDDSIDYNFLPEKL